jgi:peptidoglycan/LPS O-acetylase OafA/YrhL
MTLVLAVIFPMIYRGICHFRPQVEDPLKAMFFVSLFLCGILLAQHLEKVARWYRARNWMQRCCIAMTSILLYTLGHFDSHVSVSFPLISLGALGLIVLALNSEWVRWLLQRKIPVFLGRISYSLYLVHIPVLFSLTFAFHTRLGRVGMFFTYVPAAILAGTLFNRVVEEPMIRLNRRIRRSTATIKTEEATIVAAPSVS